MRNINIIATIAFRDYAKFLRDRTRILATFIFPILFVGVLGSSLQANLAEDAGYNFMAFIFTGVIGQVLFQSTASGIISLIEDRKNDFAQELFVSPVSRYVIILGKIVGESTVSLTQGIGVVAFGLIIGIPLTLEQFINMAPAAVISCLLGGAFGILALSNLGSERSANQIFPFIIFPQFFLAGVFSPIKNLPLVLEIMSKISPMRYAVDLVRGVYYAGSPEYSKIVLASVPTNLAIITVMFFAFLIPGTILFVRNERNR
jgi:ABC-2 type transport system permease protein